MQSWRYVHHRGGNEPSAWMKKEVEAGRMYRILLDKQLEQGIQTSTRAWAETSSPGRIW